MTMQMPRQMPRYETVHPPRHVRVTMNGDSLNPLSAVLRGWREGADGRQGLVTFSTPDGPGDPVWVDADDIAAYGATSG